MHILARLDSKLNFGAYADRDIRSVPLAYVQWLITNDVIKYARDRDQLEYLKLASAALDHPPGHLFLSVDDSMPIGKHAGMTLRDIATEYPDYFCWLHAKEVVRCHDPFFNVLLGMAIANSDSFDTIDFVESGRLRAGIVRRRGHDPACGDDRFDHHADDHFMNGYEGDR